MATNYDEIVLQNAVSGASNTSAVEDFGRFTDDASILIITTGSPTFSYQLQGSIDGVNFANLGSAIVATGQTKVVFTTTGPCRYFKGALSALSGGTFTAKLAAIT